MTTIFDLPSHELADIRCLLEENLSAIHELIDSLPAADTPPDSEEPECYDCQSLACRIACNSMLITSFSLMLSTKT